MDPGDLAWVLASAAMVLFMTPGLALFYGGMDRSRNVLNMLIQTAQEKNIPFQRAASSRFTGTDTDAFAYSNEGVPSALISLPLKYMHTTVETASKRDIENVTDLMVGFLEDLDPNFNYKYVE